MRSHIPCHLAVLLATCVWLTAPPTRATEVGTIRPVGVGVAIGDPTGLVGKIFTSPNRAWDAGLSLFSHWARCHDANGNVARCPSNTNLSISVNHLWIQNLLKADVKLDMHWGLGGRVWLFTGDRNTDNFALAARVPLGIDIAFNNPDFLETYIEFAPILAVYPSAFLHLEAALGVRFYF